MKKQKLTTMEDFLRRHPFRVKVGKKRHDIPHDYGDVERTVYVSNINAALSGLPIGWGILEAHSYDFVSGEFVKIL